MSLEDAMLKLAASMDRYAGVLEGISNSNPTQIAIAAGGTAPAADAAPAGKPGRKKKEEAAPAAEEAAAPVSEPDPFADEEAEEEAAPELTADNIRALVMKVKDKDKSHALALLKKIGAETVSKIPPSAYPKVVELAAKVGVSL